MRLERSIGLIGLTFVALSGMLGSGWLFVPLFVSQLAGPAGILSWIIGAVAVLILALCYAEIGAMAPVPGGLARVPWLSHGNVVSAAMGWSAWVGYTTAAPIETLAMLKYLGPQIPFIYATGAPPGGDNIDLSAAGYGVAIGLLIVMIVINAIGVRFFASINTGLTWIKFGAPMLVALVLVLTQFEFGNFSSHGFAPYGLSGVMAGVSSGGVIFAFIGFRHAIDMAGETRNPQTTIPLALVGSVLICLATYLIVQTVFIGSVPPDDLAQGWAAVTFDHHYGAFAAIALVVGIPWLMAVIYGSAVIAPFGGGLVATGSNARLAMALAENGFFPRFVASLSRRGVPLNGLIINLIAGAILFLFIEFETLVSLNSSAIVLSFAIGPIALYALRLQAPHLPRHFRLPFVRIIACTGFVMANWILYWSGWNTLWILGLSLIVGLALFSIRRAFADPATRPPLDVRQAWWLWPYLVAVGLTSYLGDFGGGLEVIRFGWGVWLLTALAIGFFVWAVRLRLPAEQARLNIRTALTDPDTEIDATAREESQREVEDASRRQDDKHR